MNTEISTPPISLFKFRAGNEDDLDSLHNDYLWFPACEDLNDPFEAMAFIDDEHVDAAMYKKFREGINQKYQDSSFRHARDNNLDDKAFVRKWVNNFIASWRQKTAVFSGSKDYQYSSGKHDNPHVLGSMALWGHYANGLRGYCIEFDFIELKKSLKSRNKGRNIGSSYVDYSDFSLPEISLKTCMEGFIDDNSDKIRDEVQKAFSTKHKGTWEDEQEVRLFGLEKGAYYFDASCIRAVYLGEKMPEWKKNAIKACLQSKESSIDIAKICIDVSGRNYQLKVRDYP